VTGFSGTLGQRDSTLDAQLAVPPPPVKAIATVIGFSAGLAGD